MPEASVLLSTGFILETVPSRNTRSGFGPPGVPATFVVDAEGAVIRTLTGPVTEEQIDAALDPLVSSTDMVDPTG